jgi:type IV secretion system protein VirB4
MNTFSLIDMLVQTVSSSEVIVAFLGVIAAIAFASLFITKIGEYILPKPQETRVADFLPFSYLDTDGATIHCKNGTLARVFELHGMDITLLLPEERESLMEAKKRWIDSMAELEVTSRVITIRERVPLKEVHPHSNPLLHSISERWIVNLKRIYRNKHYAVISVNDRKSALRDLDQASQALTAIMDPYQPVLVSEHPTGKNFDKSPFWLFAQLASPLNPPQPHVGKEEGDVLNSLLTTNYIHFTGDEGLIRFFAGDKEKLCIVMGIRKPGDFMDEQMIADLMAIDGELHIVHNIKAIPFIKANAILMQQRKMAAMTSMSPGVYDQYTEAMQLLDATDANAQTLNEYAMTLFLFGETKEELTFAQEEVERICRLHNVTPVREGWIAQASYFSQFPTYEVYPRTFLYLSDVVACSISMDKTAEGLTKSDWGPGPISYFKTIAGTAYSFQFHVTEDPYAVGHTALIGPTGQGKTTLFSFLAGQAMRFDDLHVYFFDRNNGAKVFALMLDSPYVRFDGDDADVTLNPFAVPDSSANRAFLRTWLRDITGGTDALSEQEIARAVTTAFNYLRPEERILKNLYKSCFSPNGYMRRELFRWVNDDQYGKIFNSKDDNLDMSSHYMAFDFTNIFQDAVLAPAVISYIMHRIHTLASASGNPSLIMIDETAPMLEHPMFKDSFIVGLREGRKKRQAFLCAFQQPNFLESHGLGDVIRGQCQTVIFFRNPQANEADYASWNLSPREMNFIAGREFTEKRYAVLVSRPAVHESVILDIDLGGLGPLLKVYSSGNKHVMLAEQLRQQISDNGAFVKAYLDKA